MTDTCLPIRVHESGKLLWLPEPVLEADEEHFIHYDTVKNIETTEKVRPSLTVQKPRKESSKLKSPTREQQQTVN